MRQRSVILFVVLFLLLGVGIIVVNFTGLEADWMKWVLGVLWIASAGAFIGAVSEAGRTDGDLIAGAEDEDGLVFSLNTPVNELVQKKRIIFDVVKEQK